MGSVRTIGRRAVVLSLAGAAALLVLTLAACDLLTEAALGGIELKGTQSTARTLTAGNSYFVSATWRVEAAVVVEPGVTITMTSGANIEVRDAGSLSAVGTAIDPILIKGQQGTAGYWGYILFRTDNINNELRYVEVRDGGGSSAYPGIVYGWGGRLKIGNTVIRNSQRHGFYIYGSGFYLDEFSENVIRDCVLAPVSIVAENMTDIDSLSQFIDNTNNKIAVRGTNTIPAGTAHTWRKTHVPFLIEGLITINNDVTVDPGARFEFGSGGRMVVKDGSLKAIGTVAERIEFTGAQQTKGYWSSIVFQTDDTNNEFQYVDVSYGGDGSGGYNGSIYLWGARFRLGNSSVTNSQTYGITLYGSSNVFTDDGNNTFDGNVLGDIYVP